MTRVYLHEIDSVRPGELAALRAAVGNRFTRLAARHGLSLAGYWETAPSQGHWPQTVELWEFENFPAYLRYLHATRSDKELIDWQEQKGELISHSVSELCRPSSMAKTALEAKALKHHELWLHEMVETKPSRQYDYVRMVEQFLIERIVLPAGREILGNFIPVFNNRLVINIWPHGEILTSTMGKYWPGETEYQGEDLRNSQIWMTLGPEVRMGWEDRFLLPVHFD